MVSASRGTEGGTTHQCERVGEEHEARRVVGQVFGYVLQVLVHRLILVLLDLERRLVDQVCGRRVSASSFSVHHRAARILKGRAGKEEGGTMGDIHTNHGLGILRATRREPELPQVLARGRGEGVEAGLGGLRGRAGERGYLAVGRSRRAGLTIVDWIIRGWRGDADEVMCSSLAESWDSQPQPQPDPDPDPDSARHLGG